MAARLDQRTDSFFTRSGRKVALTFFVEPGKLDQVAFALEALKKAMKWDEETYGLEVDLVEDVEPLVLHRVLAHEAVSRAIRGMEIDLIPAKATQERVWLAISSGGNGSSQSASV